MIRENRLFFICFLLFAIAGAGMLDAIPQGQEVLYCSGHRHPVSDWIFRWGTRLGEGYAFLAAALAFILLRRYVGALCIGVMGFVLLWVSHFAKSWFAQDRPAAWFQKLGYADAIVPVDGVPLLSGATSFPSGHTMAAFALYSFLAFVVPQKRFWPVVFFLLALLVGASRIYLGQHFLKDVYAGATLGLGFGMMCYGCYSYLLQSRKK